MYLIALAWMYVTLIMAASENSVVAGILTFVFYGALPCGLLLWLLGKPGRKRRKTRQSVEEQLDTPDRTDTDTE